MGMFDKDPKYQQLKHIREVEGYKGWLDQDLKKVPGPPLGGKPGKPGKK